MEEILALVKNTNQLMTAFSESSNQALREAQLQTQASLEKLRSTAASAAGQAGQMKTIAERMQAKIVKMGKPAICWTHAWPLRRRAHRS